MESYCIRGRGVSVISIMFVGFNHEICELILFIFILL